MSQNIFLGLIVLSVGVSLFKDSFVGLGVTLIVSASFVVIKLFQKQEDQELKQIKKELSSVKDAVTGLQIKDTFSSEKFKDKRLF